MNLQMMQDNNQKMSSREIAQLCEKRHDNVCRDIDSLNATYHSMGFLKIEEGYYTHPSTGNQQHRQFLLTQEQTLDLVTGYNAELRIRVNRRWQELERQLSTPTLPNFSNPVEAARAWANEVEARQQATQQLESIKPKAIALDNISHAKGSIGIREAGKITGLGQNKFIKWCLGADKPISSRFIYRDMAGVLNAYQHRINQGYMTQKVNSFVGGDGRDRVAPKVKFTAAGIAKIAQLLAKEKGEVA